MAAFGLTPERFLAAILGDTWAQEVLAIAPAYLTGDIARWTFVVAAVLLLFATYWERQLWPKPKQQLPRGDDAVGAPASQNEQLSGWQLVPARFEAWDDCSHLTVWQAACLWGGWEPDFDTAVSFRSPAYAHFSMLLRAIQHGEIVPSLIDQDMRHTQLARSDLIKLARLKGRRPKFLFHEDRSKDYSEVRAKDDTRTFMRFDTRAGKVIDSLNVDDSYTDNGVGDYTFSFVRPLKADAFVCHPIGATPRNFHITPIAHDGVTITGVRVVFDGPEPELIALRFDE